MRSSLRSSLPVRSVGHRRIHISPSRRPSAACLPRSPTPWWIAAPAAGTATSRLLSSLQASGNKVHPNGISLGHTDPQLLYRAGQRPGVAHTIYKWPAGEMTFGRASFSTTAPRKGKRQARRIDRRITLIRYHLSHALTPRPLRFSRLRALRHWTIHRAWQIHQRQQRDSCERELEHMYNSMRGACEALRTLPAGDGRHGPQGYLYRKAMEKKGVWDEWPIEATRTQTDWPSREGWNASWSR